MYPHSHKSIVPLRGSQRSYEGSYLHPSWTHLACDERGNGPLHFVVQGGTHDGRPDGKELVKRLGSVTDRVARGHDHEKWIPERSPDHYFPSKKFRNFLLDCDRIDVRLVRHRAVEQVVPRGLLESLCQGIVRQPAPTFRPLPELPARYRQRPALRMHSHPRRRVQPPVRRHGLGSSSHASRGRPLVAYEPFPQTTRTRVPARRSPALQSAECPRRRSPWLCQSVEPRWCDLHCTDLGAPAPALSGVGTSHRGRTRRDRALDAPMRARLPQCDLEETCQEQLEVSAGSPAIEFALHPLLVSRRARSHRPI